MIPGTVIRPLKGLVDERGYLMEKMALDWPDVFGSEQARLTPCISGFD